MVHEATVPTLLEIRNQTEKVFGVRPCSWQLKVVEAILKQDRDIVSIAGTGMGKTLTFWMPLLFRPKNSIQIIVTPLNLLGKQNVESMERAGFKAVFISADTATAENFYNIESGEYQAIIINPEELMKHGGGFEALCKNPNFANRIVSIIFDEAHCISVWGGFRTEYKEVGRLRYLISDTVPIVITSATLPPLIYNDIKDILHLRSERLTIFRCSTDRPNIRLVVRPISNPLGGYTDLDFLICGWAVGHPPPPKFLVFFDDISDSVRACLHLRSLLPLSYREKVKWFNSDMSNQFKDDEVTRMANGDSWGLFTTDSFRMGMDIPDVRVVVQWRATCSLSALWQRFGRGGRDRTIDATAVFLVEKEYFDEERRKKEVRRNARVKKRKGLTENIQTPSERQTQPAGDTKAVTNTMPADADSSSDDDEPRYGMASSWIATLSARYTTRETPTRSSKKRTLEPAIDDLINTGPRGFKCRRVPLNVYFENHKADSDHLACNPVASDGCVRCFHAAPTICCDLHNPNAFDAYHTVLTKVSRPPMRSRLAPKYKMSANEFALRDALQDWREAKTIERYGPAHFNDLGPTLIMPADVFDRIIDCAHHFKINSIEDLVRETRWDEADSCGGEVVELIARLCPKPPEPLPIPASSHSLPLSATNTSSTSAVNPLRAKSKCRACGSTGHNARNRLCPKSLMRDSSSKENVSNTLPEVSKK